MLFKRQPVVSLILLSVIVASCTYFNKSLNHEKNRQINSVENEECKNNSTGKPRYFVITVHGLGGSKNSFGDIEEVLKLHINKILPQYDAIIKQFEYPTGESESNNSFKFALDPETGLGHFIETLSECYQINKNDKLAFIAHSQGGIVTYTWFFSQILQNNGKYSILKNIDTIITLGTPFWGSKIATLFTDEMNRPYLSLAMNIPGLDVKVTHREIEDMAFYSDRVENLRKAAIAMDNSKMLNETLESLPVRLVNIAGLLPENGREMLKHSVQQNKESISKLTQYSLEFLYWVFKGASFGRKTIESDIAVILPSSRWDFIYSKPINITHDTVISKDNYSDFKHFRERSKFIYTESSHMPFETDKVRSMAFISKDCVIPENCDHPTYRYLLEQLVDCKKPTNLDGKDCNEEQFTNIVQKMKVANLEEHQKYKNLALKVEGFSSSVIIKLPPYYLRTKMPVKYMKVKPGLNAQDTPTINDWILDVKALNQIGKTGIINFNENKEHLIAASGEPKVNFYVGLNSERQSFVGKVKYSQNMNDTDEINLHFTGYIEDKNKEEAALDLDSLDDEAARKEKLKWVNKYYVLPFEINLPDLPKVKINLKVKPGYSTFTDLDFSKNKIKY